MDDSTGLENRRAARRRGFESLPFRHQLDYERHGIITPGLATSARRGPSGRLPQRLRGDAKNRRAARRRGFVYCRRREAAGMAKDGLDIITRKAIITGE